MKELKENEESAKRKSEPERGRKFKRKKVEPEWIFGVNGKRKKWKKEKKRDKVEEKREGV